MPTYTREATDTIVLMKVGSSNRAANDVHLTIGRGSGTKSDYIGRVEFRIPEPSNFPASGRLISALMTVQESSTTIHPWFDGESSRIEVRRMSERAHFSLPAVADGHNDGGYTSEGSGDHFPGAAVTGSVVTVSVNGHQSFDVTSLVRQMLPTSLGGSNELYGYFQIRSVDESNANRSVILARKISLSITIDTRVVPSVPTVLEVIGAQADLGSAPTVVATDDGRTLAIRFGFSAGAGETCAKAELQLYGTGATDATPGTVLFQVTNAPPLSGGGTGKYIARLTGITKETEGKWRLRATSSSGKEGPWTSLEDAEAHVLLATIPGPPVDVVVTTVTEDPDISASMPTAHQGTITGMQALVTLLPQGRVWDSGMVDIGGSLRRATLVYGGEALADLQRTSTVVRIRDENLVVGKYSAARVTTHLAPPPIVSVDASGPVLTPPPGRQTGARPTFTITATSFDGWRLRLLHETDDDTVLYDTGAVTVVDQTSVVSQIPAGKLTYGQKFRATASVKFNGETTFEAEIPPQPYSIAALTVCRLSVPEAVNGKVQDQTPIWMRHVTDPDGATLGSLIIEVNEAATPQGSGDRVTKYVTSGTAALLETVVIPSLTIPWETSVDAVLWARNDINVLLNTTLNGGVAAGVTQVTLASTTNITPGMRCLMFSATTGHTEERAISTLPGANVVTFVAPLEWAHLNGEIVQFYVPCPFSPWITITAMQPPDVEPLTPLDQATITRPWRTLIWSFTGHGGRTQASAVVTLRDEDDQVVATIEATTDNEVDVPAYLLEDDATYTWDVTVMDTQGMTATSSQWSFETSFSVPDALVNVSAEVAEGNVLLSWDAPDDLDLHHVEVSWLADDGAWVRIDDGPEEYGDGRVPFVDSSLVHVGARLGSNAYMVRPHNGWAAAEPTNASAVLTWTEPRRGTWELARGNGDVIPVRVNDGSSTTSAILDMSQPPGGENRALSWGIGARSIPMRVTVIPTEDGPLTTTLRSLMGDPARGRSAAPVWVRSPAGYALDPVWCVLSSFTATPSSNGMLEASMDWVEVGPAVHAILPPPPTTLPDGIPEIYSDLGEYDFGEVTE